MEKHSLTTGGTMPIRNIRKSNNQTNEPKIFRIVVKWRKHETDPWLYDVLDLLFAIEKENQINNSQLLQLIPGTIAHAQADIEETQNAIDSYYVQKRYRHSPEYNSWQYESEDAQSAH
jgi:hypothetical protein